MPLGSFIFAKRQVVKQEKKKKKEKGKKRGC
jgi:hypothetical protein